MGDFSYNAPQYIDFSSPTALEPKEFGEEYFDMDHEVEVEFQEMNGEDRNPSPDSTQHGESCFQSFSEENVSTTPPPASQLADQEPLGLRRSMSTGHITLVHQAQCEPYPMDETLSQALDSLQLTGTKKKPLKAIHPPSQLSKLRFTTYSVSQSSSRPKTAPKPRSVSRDGLNRISYSSDKLKRKGSVECLQPKKFISMAEAVRHYQCGTPQRFRSKTAGNPNALQHQKITSLTHTVPQSPLLVTKARSRPTTYISREQLENQEAEQMRKHQIKAQPVNYKILQAPAAHAKVDKKPITLPQPFKFAEVKFQQKAPQPEESDLYVFHARPAPKSTAPTSRPVLKKSVLPCTVAHTPTFVRKLNKEKIATLHENPSTNKVDVKNVNLHYDGVPVSQPVQKLTRTRPEPFSFEERDKRMQRRKEEKIQKFIEEEKKAREFHAKPIPKIIAGANKTVESKVGKSGSTGSLSSRGNDENMEPSGEQKLFKARPASVIYKKPFVPKKPDRPLMEVSEFSLNTIRRAKEREEFDKKKKEKEEEDECRRKEFEETARRIEQEQVAKLRKDAVHKANPIKHYKQLEIKPSTKQVTSPCSPMITKPRRHNTEE